MTKPVLDIKEVPGLFQGLSLSTQHLFAMFGATVLVPYLVGLSPAMALISSGLGTLAFILITKGKVPAYWGSSFAFIVPLEMIIKSGGGIGPAMIGTFFVGLVYVLVALLIKGIGYKWIMKLLPPIVVGPVIIVIGLSLSGTAMNMAMINPDTKEKSMVYFSVAVVTLLTAILLTIFGRGMLGLVPILGGIVVGYLYAWIVGIVDFSGVKKADWFEMPDFVFPIMHYDINIPLEVVLLMVPVAVVTISEHIGHQLVLSKIVGKNLIKDPGLHRSILGDGTATIISALVGGPPKTTYGENIGVLALTKVYSVYVIAGAAIIATIFGFIGKITALISSIPAPVMGGVSILLFGIIASSGLRMLVDSKIDFGNNRNLVISSVILIVGIGGVFIDIEGLALASILGILLNIFLPGGKEAGEDMFEESALEKDKALDPKLLRTLREN